MTKLGFAGAVVAALLVGAVQSSQAALIVVDTAIGATQGGAPVSAHAAITTGSGTVTIVLSNLTVDPPSAAQCLSGFEFHLTTGQNSGTLSSSSGVDRTINSDGTYSDGSAVSTGWALSTVSSDLKLNLLGTPTAPSHQIVGPPNSSSNLYTGNPSVTGSSHQPHLGLSSTFNLSVPGVTSASVIDSAIFQFNTSPGSTNPGTPVVVVPEPASAAILSLVGLGMGLGRRRRNAAAS